uniref:Uncharacterized protein n=1 Tax=Timema monikensis TaxID=170555 RepID=A0A7R9EII6_9NEOP|nr:unnamed protein product [Timema monikensis]
MNVSHVGFQRMRSSIKQRMLNTLPGAHLTDLSASVVMLSNADKLRILDTLDVAKRVNILRPLVSQYIKNLELNQSSLSKSSNQPSMTVVRLRIPSQPMSNRQANWISLARNKQELGDDLEELQNKLDNSQLPTHAYNVASKELQRLKRMSALSPEAGIIRSYVELFTELPWGKVSPETLDVIKARQPQLLLHLKPRMDSVRQLASHASRCTPCTVCT